MRQRLRTLPGADQLRSARERSYLWRKSSLTPFNFYFSGNKKMRRGHFESDVVQLLALLGKERNYKTFVDIGAHHGYFCCLANVLGLSIFAVEPNPINHSILMKNLKDNGVNPINVMNVALGERVGDIKMYGFGTGFSIYKNWAKDVSKESVNVPMTTLDLLDLNLNDCIIKIDVEGAELKVLEGGQEKLNSSKRIFVIIEASELEMRTTASIDSQSNIKSVIEFLIGQGFSPVKFDKRQDLVHISADKFHLYLEEVCNNESVNLFFEKP